MYVASWIYYLNQGDHSVIDLHRRHIATMTVAVCTKLINLKYTVVSYIFEGIKFHGVLILLILVVKVLLKLMIPQSFFYFVAKCYQEKSK